MEACGTPYYWGRVAQSLVYQVKLLHPRYVRPYRQCIKTDRNDCDVCRKPRAASTFIQDQ